MDDWQKLSDMEPTIFDTLTQMLGDLAIFLGQPRTVIK